MVNIRIYSINVWEFTIDTPDTSQWNLQNKFKILIF